MVAAIVDSSPTPTSTLNPKLQSLEELGKRYSAPIFSSVDALLSSGVVLNGAIVSTPHASHFTVGMQLLTVPNLHILMEKPFTTDVVEARTLRDAAALGERNRVFLVNHSANAREQCALAAACVASGSIGSVEHVTAFLGSALLWLFEDPEQPGWTQPQGTMVGNGFGWGQMSHLLAWVFRVTGLEPATVSCVMVHSATTGADLHDSATVTCTSGATVRK
jgi:predicted dehydrogenase